jgi:hypothetical protein
VVEAGDLGEQLIAQGHSAASAGFGCRGLWTKPFDQAVERRWLCFKRSGIRSWYAALRGRQAMDFASLFRFNVREYRARS